MPPLDKSTENCTSRIAIKVRPSEHEVLKELADGQSIAAFVRSRLGLDPPPPVGQKIPLFANGVRPPNPKNGKRPVVNRASLRLCFVEASYLDFDRPLKSGTFDPLPRKVL